MTSIALISPRYPPNYAGGGEISAQLLVKQLQRQSEIDDVTVYSFDGNRDEMVNGVSVHRLADTPQYPYTVANEIAYRKLHSQDLEYDVFHAYNMHLHPAVGRLSKTTKIPAVATLNAYPLLNWQEVNVDPSLQRRIYELTLLRLERPRLVRQMHGINIFLPLSHSVKRIYRNNGFEDCNFKVIPNMIDLAFDRPTITRDGSEGTKVLYVGYLRNSKAVRYLIDAMGELPSEYHLEIVGDGPERGRLQKRAEKSDIANRINFKGKIPYEDVKRAYSTADIFVHPGVWPEPFGRTVLEAMQSGLPVVATNIGGPSETVPQKELLCKPRDAVGLGKAIEYADEHRDRLGRENMRIAEQKYHPNSLVPHFLKVYDRVV
jgi:glycosyltransferase involved in cell wall biosynthesis